MPRKWTPWNPEWDKLLGTMPDRHLARKLDITWATVRRHRMLLGIPTWISEPKHPKHQRIIDILKNATDEQLTAGNSKQVAKQLRISELFVRQEIRRRKLVPFRNKRLQTLDQIVRAGAVKGALEAAHLHGDSRGAQSAIARILHLSRERVSQLVEKVKKDE